MIFLEQLDEEQIKAVSDSFLFVSIFTNFISAFSKRSLTVHSISWCLIKDVSVSFLSASIFTNFISASLKQSVRVISWSWCIVKNVSNLFLSASIFTNASCSLQNEPHKLIINYHYVNNKRLTHRHLDNIRY